MDSRKGRRKSASPGARTVASPPALAIKRSDAAPVTLKGWLYKQGSDGLQLWKKRWFVLSEFCLFYYKGPNEDKVSGSILLPSYIISPLSKDDGVYRKYAFKAEHANMRTYYFAAETKDGMIQWMNSLSLASILQNENKLRPEVLARELARQGAAGRGRAHGAPHTQTLPSGMVPGRQSATRIVGLQQHRSPMNHPVEEGDGRQPLYANAPPKPKRVNNSSSRDDTEYTPEHSPERAAPYPEEVVRHRLPQERRTPEAYGRSKFESHHSSAVPQKDYEEVYNNGYSQDQRRYSEEVWQHAQQQGRSLGRGGHQPQAQPRVPRPHSADFLEYEAEGVVRQQEPARPAQRSQPQRPKSCIGEKARPEDFWSEEVYAQKMRESAGWQYDTREVRSQSRGPRNSMSRSSALSPDYPQEPAVHPLQISPARTAHNTSQGSQGDQHFPGQVPPPAIYQDQSPRDAGGHRGGHHSGPGRQQQHPHQNSSYREDQEVAALRLTPHQYRAQQEAWFTQQREAQELQMQQAQQRPHSQQRQPQTPLQQQQIQQQHYQQQQQQYQQQLQYHQEQLFLQQQLHQQEQQMQQHHQQHQQQQHQTQQEQFQKQKRHSQPAMGQAGGDPRITVPPSLPQPMPRKAPGLQTPTMYQNLPVNSRAYSDPRPPGHGRLESATPNPRGSERFDSDNSRDSAGDFRRSASARLPKNKARGGDPLNNTFNESGSGDSARSGEQVGREESMKRLLDWKQRMLQSPLTRKSSRNASRTQTPTNSDSPVPSLNNDDIRKKVLEELQQPSTPNVSKDRRLSRKGSSGSRSSRSRSSPRIAANKNQLYSSDDEDLHQDPRASRKRTKSASGRSRNPSNSNSKRNSLAKSRSRSASLHATDRLDDQPEYININSLKAQERPELELPRSSKIKPVNAIGPDDWYRDDFDFDKSHPFMDDPMLLKQYAQILDMKYRDSSTERIEEMLNQGSLMNQAELERSLYSESRGDLVTEEPMSLASQTFGTGRYPDSGYDTLKFDLHGDNRSQLCVNIDIKEEQRRLEVEVERAKEMKSWHSSNFADFQLMDKGEDTVFLSIEGHGEDLESTIKRSPRDRGSDKVDWQLGKSYKDLRKEKEAPPKNVVKERLKSFESSHDAAEAPPASGEERPRPESRGGEKFKIKGDLFKQVGSPRLRDEEEEEEESSDADDKVLMKKLEAAEKKLEHKRSVKDLLSDFERKSKALQEKEEGRRVSGIGSYLLQDCREAGGRRVFSDTETLMYETSSEEEHSEEELSPRRPPDKVVATIEAEPEKPPPTLPAALEPPPLPPKRPPPGAGLSTESTTFQVLPGQEGEAGQGLETPAKDDKRRPDRSRGVAQGILNEETYLTMTPSKSVSSLPSTPVRKGSQGMLGSAHNSVTSLTSSHSSIASGSGNRGSMTPTEALIHSSAASISHSRTPSQSLVMEHFGLAGRHEETYVEMNDDGSQPAAAAPRHRGQPVLARQGGGGGLDTTLTNENDESPRYCEIEEKSHYELLSNARTATAQLQHYEVVYQEIAGEVPDGANHRNKGEAVKGGRRRELEPLRPIEGLPDILGNAPTNKGNSSSDADDESSKDFEALETLRPAPKITLDDSFRPASFYLSHCKASLHDGGSGNSSDSDLVSPPPVPSSPPPMEEVLGFPSPSHLDTSMAPDHLSSVLAAVMKRSCQEEGPGEARRPSVSSRASAGSQQSLSREAMLSPARLHGSQQSLGSRELPPLPTGSQQSLASREVQAMVGRGSREVLVISPFHSREGSLDNEAFLRPSFTHGGPVEPGSHRSTSAELSSSDTANYEQEYRRYHLENIQEVSNTLERTEAGVSHNTSIISQDLNISYNSVYDSRLQQSKVYRLEDHPVLQKRKSLDDRQHPKYFQPDPHSAEIEAELHSPRSKVPYYVSDLEEAPGEEAMPGSLGMVDVITQSMNALDVESKSYFEDKNQVENERIKMLRRSYTPDPYLTKNAAKESSSRQPAEGPFESNSVSRSKSLEGLLGDSHGGPKANLGYAPAPRNLCSPRMFQDSPQPARGYQPPPPPPGVPPLDLRVAAPSPAHRVSLPAPPQEEEDEVWAENLRRASLRQHRAASTPPSEDRIRCGPPPTAPKPKTPVHFQSAAAPAGPVQHSGPGQPPHRNSTATPNYRAANFLESGPPTPSGQPGPTLSTSRPSSRGVGGRGGQRHDMASKSMTLPARIKYSQDLNTSRQEHGFEDNSPRTRTSKSGLPEDAEVVPPSPRHGEPQATHSLPRDGQHRQRDAAEEMARARRKSGGGRSSDLETLKRKLGGNLANITAGDLLGRSHEELVLILIQLRRQATSLTEASDTCRAELDNMRNTGEQGGELRHHAWELEEQLARLGPVISLVDNMVKLGTLYRGQDSGQPLAQRVQANQQEHRVHQINNINTINNNNNSHNANINDPEEVEKGKLKRELQRVQAHLMVAHRGLEESGEGLGRLELELTQLTRELAMRGGREHRQAVEGRIQQVQETASNMQRRRLGIMQQIQELTQKEDFLTNEIRPSPSGVAGAEPVPQRPRLQETWYETDIDNNYTRDRGPETEDQLRQESRVVGLPANSQQAMYVNTFKEEQHNYENYENYENFRAQERLQNPYEDEVATVHSEGVASQAPGLPPRDGEDWVQGRMGDISEADERVQRFYGILPKEVKGEVKTPRMVKQASRKSSRSRGRGSGEEDSESQEVESGEEEPPPPLPRGNFTQMHNFLSNMPYEAQEPPRSAPLGPESGPAPSRNTRPNFRLGDTSASSSRPPSRPGSSLSAHERLFGASREESLSPEGSPVKSASIASTDSQASSQAMMSPVFKSAAARAIIEEERKTPVQIIAKARKKPLKKRHMTISGSQPAVQEALARHEAGGRGRARDDLDMERMLKPRDAPDVVRSTYTGENPWLPEKISIPERYVPEQAAERSPEERRTRLKKADSIRRMLAESQAAPAVTKREGEQPVTMTEERRQREQILALSQVLARQVMEKSRLVAGQPKE